MYIRQIKHGTMGNFSYLAGCEQTKKAIAVDPAPDADVMMSAAREDGYTITAIVNTHGHGDHTAGNAALKAATGAPVIIHEDDADRLDSPDNTFSGKRDSISVGNLTIDVIHTPGHTPGGVCLYAEGNLITGDTLFVGDSGRTDLPGGHRPTLGASIKGLMDTLPGDTVIYPGHDLGTTPTSTLDREKRENVNRVEYGYAVID